MKPSGAGYAETFARLMAEDTQRVLQFQLKYDRAFRRLHPNLVAFDAGPKSRRSEALSPTLVPMTAGAVGWKRIASTYSVISMCQPRHRHGEWLKFLRLIDRRTPKHLTLHLIVDNYATHTHPDVQKWLARHPRSSCTSLRPAHHG